MSLKELWLDNNVLTSVDTRTFNGLASLKEVSLNSNLLVSIEASVFSGLTNLRRVYMGDNPVTVTNTTGVLALCSAAGNPLCRISTKSYKDGK